MDLYGNIFYEMDNDFHNLFHLAKEINVSLKNLDRQIKNQEEQTESQIEKIEYNQIISD